MHPNRQDKNFKVHPCFIALRLPVRCTQTGRTRISKFKDYLVGLIFFLFGTTSSFAFGNKYAGEFLKIGVGVREMSLGGAVVASPRSVSAQYWNPAVLYKNTVFSGQFMHTEEFAGTLNLDHISVAIPAKGNYAYGLGFFRLGVNDIPDTRGALIDNNGNGKLDPGERLNFGKIGTFGASENALFISVAKQINQKFFIGATTKHLYKSLGTTAAWGVGFDVATIYNISPQLVLGASLNDITTTFLFWKDGEKEVILPTLRFGTAWKAALPSIPIWFQPLGGLDISFEGKQHSTDLNLGSISGRVHLGLEIHIKDQIALRCGRDDLGSFHIGFGLDTSIGSIDYGFAMGGTYQLLGQSHRIGVTLHFAELAKGLKRWL